MAETMPNKWRRDDQAPSDRLRAGTGFHVGRWFGVQINADWSLLIVFSLIVVNLGSGVFPVWHPHWSPTLSWAVASLAAALFVLSILLHELGHALVARRFGIPVNRITLYLFGGLAHMEGEPPTPKSEFLMAIVGPAVSIAIGVLATFVAGGLGRRSLGELTGFENASDVQELIKHLGPITTLLLWLGPINIVLGVFNLIPGFPLDGGRVLRSILWGVSGDMLKATRWAAGVGSFVAFALIGLGVMQMFDGMFAQGLWLILIGWFLNNAARMSYEQLLARRLLHDIPVSRVMWTHPPRVAPDVSVESFVDRYVLGGDEHTALVEGDGRLLGIVSFKDARKVPQRQWSVRTVSEIMTPIAQLATLPADAHAERALDALARQDVDEIPIMNGSELCGVVRQRDLVRWIALHMDQARAA